MHTKSILIAEDEAMLRRVLKKVLLRAGYEVVLVEDGTQAWEKLQSRNFDLVVLDQNMPGYTGTELLAMIHTQNPKTKVVIASGDSLPESAVAPIGMIEKPFVLSSLLSKIKDFLAS